MTEEERKEKKRADNAAWRKANPEKVKSSSAKYQKANLDKFKTANLKWQKKNLEKLRVYRAAYQKNRRAADPVYAMSVRLRNRLSLAFKTNGYKKQSTTEQMLGCSFAKFKMHIEKQFINGMSWDNRADWHLDHILPLSCATTGEGLEKLSHYSNIRPIWAADNLAKSDNLVLTNL
jgi:hypothetical protein